MEKFLKFLETKGIIIIKKEMTPEVYKEYLSQNEFSHFSKRAQNALKAMNITKLEDLKKIKFTVDILRQKNCGKKTAKEIMNFKEKMDL